MSGIPEDSSTLCKGDLQSLERYVRSSWPDSLTTSERGALLRIHSALWMAGPDAIDASDARLAKARLPASWLESDSEKLTGIMGLGMMPTVHRLRAVGGAREPRFAWCGFDCLFLPQVVGADMAVASACAVTGEPLELTVTPNGTCETQGQDVRLTYVTPGPDERRSDLRNAF